MTGFLVQPDLASDGYESAGGRDFCSLDMRIGFCGLVDRGRIDDFEAHFEWMPDIDLGD